MGMYSPLISRMRNEEVIGWGTFHLVITDDKGFLPLAAQVCEVQDVVDLEDLVPIQFTTAICGPKKLMPTHICEGITEKRKAAIPWIGYMLIRPNEKEYLKHFKNAYEITSELMRLRCYPKGFAFLSHTEIQRINGKTTVVRSKTEPVLRMESVFSN